MNEKLKKDFLLYMEEKKNRVGSSSNTRVDTNSSSTHYVYFYPWSKVEGNRAEFYSNVEKFLQQMREWKIIVKPAQIGALRSSGLSYCTCIPNKRELIIRHSYKDLKESLDKYYNPPSSTMASPQRSFDLAHCYGYSSYEY